MTKPRRANAEITLPLLKSAKEIIPCVGDYGRVFQIARFAFNNHRLTYLRNVRSAIDGLPIGYMVGQRGPEWVSVCS